MSANEIDGVGSESPGEAGRKPVPAFYDDLQATLDEAWRLLTRGALDRRSPFHTPAVATLGEDGRPSIRTVVLRAADPSGRGLRFHTDARSAKVRDLRADSRVCVHFYDAVHKVQLRIDGRARVHVEGALADGAWSATRPFSRACYRVAEPPGTPTADPGAVGTGDDPSDPEDGRQNFAAVDVSIERMEWLYLAADGHRRAMFDWRAGEESSQWLVP